MTERDEKTAAPASGTPKSTSPNGSAKTTAEPKADGPTSTTTAGNAPSAPANTSRTDTPAGAKVEPKQAPDAAKTTAASAKDTTAQEGGAK